MTTYHNSQVTFFKKSDTPDLQKELDKYRPWLDSPVMDVQTEKMGKIVGINIDNGNIWFKVENQE